MATSTSPARWLARYAAVFGTLIVLDMTWILGIASDLYRQGMGHLMAAAPQPVPIALFYLLYPVGVLLFAVVPGSGRGPAAAARWGALFGLFCYGAYDLTNQALLRDWPAWLSAMDMAWGACVSAAAAACGAHRFIAAR